MSLSSTLDTSWSYPKRCKIPWVIIRVNSESRETLCATDCFTNTSGHSKISPKLLPVLERKLKTSVALCLFRNFELMLFISEADNKTIVSSLRFRKSRLRTLRPTSSRTHCDASVSIFFVEKLGFFF